MKTETEISKNLSSKQYFSSLTGDYLEYASTTFDTSARAMSLCALGTIGYSIIFLPIDTTLLFLLGILFTITASTSVQHLKIARTVANLVSDSVKVQEGSLNPPAIVELGCHEYLIKDKVEDLLYIMQSLSHKTTLAKVLLALSYSSLSFYYRMMYEASTNKASYQKELL